MILFSSKERKYVRIFDTTLRDGEQAPGIDLSVSQKIKIAKQLEKLGVDVIEAGFPASSGGEFEAVREIKREISNSEVIALSRCNIKDIDTTISTGIDTIHLFLASSDIHLKYKLKMTREEMINAVEESVKYARSHGLEVEFSPEDATRSDREFLKRVIETAVRAGARRINIPDTVGVMTPFKFYDLISYVKKIVGESIIISVHCHNDFGLAVANSLAGVEAGARQVHVTVNGIGERAGNASLEEVVMALKKLMGYETKVKTHMLYETSKVVEELTKIKVPYFKAIVGENAFGHESGIHVHGVLENPETYEPMYPEEVGNFRRIELGKHSGIHGLRKILKDMGIEIEDQGKLRMILDKIKKRAETGERITPQIAKEIAMEVLGN